MTGENHTALDSGGWGAK